MTVTNMSNSIMGGYAADFEKRIEKLFGCNNCEYRVIYDACKYSLLLGGKRLRPYLLNKFYNLCSNTDEGSFLFEAAIECIHTYSLIHDDLPCMDNDDMRRGKPSLHKAFGEANALLAGDALLTEAFLLASSTENIDSENVLKAIRVLSSCAGINGMIGGQTVDLMYEKKTADEDILRLICNLKTGALIKAACSIGCILAGADNKKISAAEKYAQNIGLAFQIVDDILDETSTEEKLGKPIHSDRENGKSTFVTLFGIEKCMDLVAQLTENAKEALDVFGDDASELKKLADDLCKRDH